MYRAFASLARRLVKITGNGSATEKAELAEAPVDGFGGPGRAHPWHIATRAARRTCSAVERSLGQRRREPLDGRVGTRESAQGRHDASGGVAGRVALGRSSSPTGGSRTTCGLPTPIGVAPIARPRWSAVRRPGGRSLDADHRRVALADPAATPRRRERSHRVEAVASDRAARRTRRTHARASVHQSQSRPASRPCTVNSAAACS